VWISPGEALTRAGRCGSAVFVRMLRPPWPMPSVRAKTRRSSVRDLREPPGGRLTFSINMGKPLLVKRDSPWAPDDQTVPEFQAGLWFKKSPGKHGFDAAIVSLVGSVWERWPE